jgi:ABC-type multidrug transport system ATPase subunit
MNEEKTIVYLESSPEHSTYSLTWEGIGYSVPLNNSKKQILNDLNGYCEAGMMIAVLGASGAGKSTFLDVLAGRKLSKNVEGSVLINGRNDIPLKHVSRYCTQDDALFGNLTVYETLDYAAKFNLPSTTSAMHRHEVVMDLIKEMGLEDQKDTRIGTPLLKGCSGGQVRRVSVASQCIGFENGILFLDEPTSGLDSVAAFSVMEAMKRLAMHKNCGIVATIHQPSSETFGLFTHILVLANGSPVFFGEREQAISYFEEIGQPVPQHSNPSDFYLHITNMDFKEDKATGRKEVDELIRKFATSSHAEAIKSKIQDVMNSRSGDTSKVNVGYTNSFVHQTTTLMHRAFKNSYKNPLSYWIRVAMYVGLAILMGTTWWQLGDNQTKVQDRFGALFFSIAFLSFMSVAGIPAFLEERLVFLRETANGLYGVESYVLSNTLISIPFIFIITISFTLVSYFMMGLQNTASAFFGFVGYLFVALMIAEAQVVFVSVAIPIFVAALAIGAFSNGHLSSYRSMDGSSRLLCSKKELASLLEILFPFD